jgi:CTP:molybdopterin cytidylyltransferase MocA
LHRSVGAVVLAAGAGSRFLADGGADLADHKLLAPFRGAPLASWALRSVAAAGFGRVIVVTGAVDLDHLVPDDFDVLHNRRWADGQATSLALAVELAEQADMRAIVVGLADQPLVPSSAWRSVGAAAGPIVTATFDGVRRPPVKLDRSVWGSLPTEGDEGARMLFKLRPELVSEVPCTGNPIDIDTVEDLDQWS